MKAALFKHGCVFVRSFFGGFCFWDVLLECRGKGPTQEQLVLQVDSSPVAP